MNRDEVLEVISTRLGRDVRWADQRDVLCDASLILETFDVPVSEQLEVTGRLMELEQERPEMQEVAGGYLTLVFRRTRS